MTSIRTALSPLASVTVFVSFSVLVGLAPIAAVHAQGLTVMASSPEDSASAVPLETEVRFTFSSAMDTRAVSESGLPIAVSAAPRDSLSIGGFSLDEDGSSLSIDVLQAANVDYTWIVTGATSRDSTGLDLPFVLRYTTASECGVHSVSGFVHRIWAVSGGGGPDDGRHAVIALLDRPMERTSEGRYIGLDHVAAAAWVPEDSEFTIDRVRNGTYWPVAFIDIDRNGRLTDDDRVQLYQGFDIPEGDSIVVDGADIDDLEIVLLVGGAAEEAEQPGLFDIGQIHPNPTAGVTQIEFDLERPGSVSLGIFNLLGQEIQSIIDGEFHAAGKHRSRWSASSLASGAYVCRLQVDGIAATRLFIVRK